MPETSDAKLIVAISSRALFALDESHAVFEQQGIEAYCQYQVEAEDKILQPGVAFPLVKKLLALNSPSSSVVEVILLSRNSTDTGLRVFNSIQHHQLDISRAAFTSGANTHSYARAFGAHLFLSANPEDVRRSLDVGMAAATILPSATSQCSENAELRIAFDGDAVIFSDEAEQIFKREGLEAFAQSEQAAARKPLSDGPFKAFLSALHVLQSSYSPADCPIRTALITARAAPAHERVIRTLRAWGIRIDEALFLGGLAKGEFLASFNADIFFDDHQGHCDSAKKHVATGHVPHGIANAD